MTKASVLKAKARPLQPLIKSASHLPHVINPDATYGAFDVKQLKHSRTFADAHEVILMRSTLQGKKALPIPSFVTAMLLYAMQFVLQKDSLLHIQAGT